MKIAFKGLPNKKIERMILKTLNIARIKTNQTSKIALGISFVSENEIKSLNLENRGIDKITDVLSFPLLDTIPFSTIDKENFEIDYDPILKAFYIGDISICLSRAVNQSIEYGHSIEREICFLALHGFLHLLGFDHLTIDDEKDMTDVSKFVMEKAHILRK